VTNKIRQFKICIKKRNYYAKSKAWSDRTEKAWADNFQRYINTDGIHYIEIDPTSCGGVSESLNIAKLAYTSGRPCTLHSSSSAVLFACDLHIAASIPNCHSVEYHMFHQLFWDKAP